MQTDLENLQGRWYIDSLEIDGAPIPKSVFSGSELIVEDNRFVSLSMGDVYEGTIELDSEQSPKAVRMKFAKGPEQGNTNHGIYQLTANTWTICLNTTGGAAPSGFTTAPGTGHALETLKRNN